MARPTPGCMAVAPAHPALEPNPCRSAPTVSGMAIDSGWSSGAR